MLRRLFILMLCCALLLVAAMALLPWWLAPVLARAGHSQGATFGAYERLGYARFVLHDVTVQQPGVQVTVARVESPTPLLWLWHRGTGQPDEIKADRWTASVGRPAAEDSNLPTVGGWLPLRDRLQRIAAGLDRWVPRASAGPGEVHWPGGGLTLESATWRERTVRVEQLRLGPGQTEATLAFPAGQDELTLTLRPTDASGTAMLTSRGPALTGTISWWGQDATLQATFAPQGWLPTAATLQGDAWEVPGARVKLGELYAMIRGHGKVEWRDGHFAADVAAKGEPVDGKSAPPLEVTLRGRGDTQVFTVEELHATLPGISAQLSEPVTVDRAGHFSQGAARFHAEVDLARQPWFAARGTARGEARLRTGVTRSPVVEFELTAAAVTAGAFTLEKAKAAGRLDWPRLEVTAATLTLSADETLTGHGGWDFRTGEMLAATLAGKINRTTLARWLPAQPEFDTLTIEAEASGPPANPVHAGRVSADGVQWPGLNPLALAATWSGHGGTLDDFTVEARAGETTITAAGAATPEGAHLTGLSLRRGDDIRLQLTAPANVTWSPALQIDSLKLTGEGAVEASLRWGDTGHIGFTLHQVASSWFEDLAPLPGPAWQLHTLTFTGRWDHGPMIYTAGGGAVIELGPDRTARLELAAQGDGHGLQVDALHATEGAGEIFSATGRAPIMLTPAPATWWQIKPDGELAIEARTQANARFWTKLGELTGVAFEEPQLTAHVTGTWAQPLGNLHLRAARITVDPARFQRPLPVLETLEATLTGDREGLKLDEVSVSIEGQAVRARGRLPVAKGAWAELINHPLEVTRRAAELHLEVPDADLAAWSSVLPPWLAPKGRLQVDLQYQGGGPLQGFVQLHDAATRPLGAIGVLQEINADVRLTGRTAGLNHVTATAGGRAVTLSGTIEFPEAADPRYAVTLRGTNLPFVRQSGLLVRGDLDLNLRSPASGPPVIGGSIQLRNSLFLSDIRSFLPGGTKGGRRLPPYFAVEAVPLNTWQLDVGVTGDRFLRLRTPLFNGVATARFHLGGTLGEPRAIGEVTIDEGQVLMPFASFSVKQGTARIAESNPHELTLFLRGTGRRYDYELTLEVTGTPEAPNVVFTSSPALDSEQLLLMVMTGVAPDDAFTSSRVQRFARLGTYLGQSLLTSLGGDATSADRLSITLGENITRQGRETYDVAYKLADRWKVIGEYDEFDNYNVGLKWRLFPGKTKPEAPADETK